MNKAILLDRDGTINIDKNYVFKIEDLEFEKNAVEGLKKLSGVGYKLIIISNQSGVARGYFTEEDLQKFNDELLRRLKDNGINIEAVYVCPHHPEGNGKYKLDCDCRKPKTGMIMKAKEDHDIDLQNSIMIGDHPKDVEVGKNVGCKTIFMLTGHGPEHKEEVAEIKPDFIADDLLDAAGWIIENGNRD